MEDIKLNNLKKKEHKDARTCPHCGANVLSEVCQYCGTYIGEVATADLSAEYPMIECKSARIDTWRVILPAIIAACCIGMTLYEALPMFTIDKELMGIDAGFHAQVKAFAMEIIIPFLLFGAIAFLFMCKGIYRWLAVRIFGVELRGTVYGYMDDRVAYNGVNGQVIKILVQTKEGKRFVMLPLETTTMKYVINSTVNVKIYKNYAAIVKEKVNW